MTVIASGAKQSRSEHSAARETALQYRHVRAVPSDHRSADRRRRALHAEHGFDGDRGRDPAHRRRAQEDPLRLNLAITSYLLSLAIFIPSVGLDRRPVRRAHRVPRRDPGLHPGLGVLRPVRHPAAARRGADRAGHGRRDDGAGRPARDAASVPKSELVRAMSYLAVPALIGPVMGPPLGGLIVTYASWRWIFFINVPFGLLGVLLVNRFIENIREEATTPLDRRGFVLAGFGLAAVMFGFETAGARHGLAVCRSEPAGGRRGAPRALWAARAGDAVADHRSRPDAHSDLRGVDPRQRHLPHRHRRPAVPDAAAAAARLRPVAVPIGPADLCDLCRGDDDEGVGDPHPPRLGFRQVLIGNAVICGLFMAGYGLFRPSTPSLVILATLLAGGFFRSLQVTSTNSLVFADVPPALMSRATSFASMAQQLWMTLGVGVSALLLRLVHLLHGGAALTAADFPPVFVLNGCIAAAAMLVFLHMAPDAGTELSGHRATPAASPRRPPAE